MTDFILLDLFFDVGSECEGELGVFIGTFFESAFVFCLLFFGVEELRDVEVDLSSLLIAFFAKDEHSKSSLNRN